MFSELGGHGDELGTCLPVILYLAGLCESAKLEVEVGTSQICRRYGGITSLNAVAFTGAGVGNVQADLFGTKDAVNAEVIENLIWFVCDNKGGEEVPSGVTYFFEKETFSTVFFRHLDL